MPEPKPARLGTISDRLEPDEEVLFDVLALLLDPGDGLKPREAEGYLVLTDRKLVFGTAKHGILVDAAIETITPPARVQYRITMAHLVLRLDDGAIHTLVLNKSAARGIADTINKAAA